VDGDHTVVGYMGVVTVATRGAGGPGEVMLTVRGSSETYFAWSEEPVGRGSRVLVVGERGPRTLDVASCDEAGFPLLG
jgi:hypothetical protein